jgi:hypothetical protein
MCLHEVGHRLDVAQVETGRARPDLELEVVREVDPLPVGADLEAV